MNAIARSFILLGFIWLIAGCAGDRDVERYGNGTTPVILTSAQQHPGGYGRKDCLVCHNAALNLHREKGTPIDVEGLNEAIRANGESAYCQTCHGTNGTQ